MRALECTQLNSSFIFSAYLPFYVFFFCASAWIIYGRLLAYLNTMTLHITCHKSVCESASGKWRHFLHLPCEKEKSGLVDAAAPLLVRRIIFQDVQSRVRSDNFDPFITTDCDAARSAAYSLLITIHMHLRGKELVIFSSIILRAIHQTTACAHGLSFSFPLCAACAL
jgi:hypothetical protein